MPACVACGESLAPELDAAEHALHPTCEALELGPDVIASELFSIISEELLNAPRSLQKRIGPSEMGIPCDRRIGYILARTPRITTETVGWEAFIGTAAHEQLANFMDRANVASLAAGNAFRWHTEQKVGVGDIDGVTITGSTDLFDAWSGTVIDWKFTTKNKIREQYRPQGPGDQYIRQAQLYGRGWQRKGFHVRQVMIVFFTRDGKFTDRYVWSNPYDGALAEDTLARANRIAENVSAGRLDQLATASAYCTYCPWYRINAMQLDVACPGHPKEPSSEPYPFNVNEVSAVELLDSGATPTPTK